MIPVFNNTLLAVPNIKLFLRFSPFFVAHQPFHQPNFLWVQTQFYSGGNCLFGEAPTLKFYPGTFDYFGGTLGPFCVQGLKIKFPSGGIFPFGESPKLKFSPATLHILGSNLDLLCFRGLKSSFISGGFYPSLGSRILIWIRVFCPTLAPNSNLTSGFFIHSQVPDQVSKVDDREQVRHAEPIIGGQLFHSAQDIGTLQKRKNATIVKSNFESMNPKRPQLVSKMVNTLGLKFEFGPKWLAKSPSSN
jgi:hypothetical protein